MDKNSSTTNPANAKATAQSANVPDNQSEPAAEEGRSASFGQRAVEAVGGGSTDAPPASFGSLLDQLQGSTSGQASVLRQLQRSYGNRYVGQVIQAKMTVSQPGDSHELEADRAADVAMRRMADPQSRASEGAQTPPVEVGGGTSQAGGQSLPPDVQQQMGQAYGADFKNVSVHTDSESETLNESLKARAFTTGQDVFFGRGQYNPHNTEGRELIAHELAHVVQQSGRGPHHPGTGVTLNPISSGSIQRQPSQFDVKLPEEEEKKKPYEKTPSEIIKETGEFAQSEEERSMASAPPNVMTTTNVADRQQAEALIVLIRAQRGNIGAYPKKETGEAMLAQNESTAKALDQYAEMLQQQNTKGDLFKRLYMQVKLDSARLEGQKAAFLGMHPELQNDILSGNQFAGAVIKGGSQNMFAGSAGMKAQQNNPEVIAQMGHIRTLLSDLQEYPDQIVNTMDPVANALAKLKTASLDIQAGTIVRNPTPEQAKAQAAVASIEADLKAATETLSQIGDVIKLAGTALGGVGAMSLITEKLEKYQGIAGGMALDVGMKVGGVGKAAGSDKIENKKLKDEYDKETPQQKSAYAAEAGVEGKDAIKGAATAMTDVPGHVKTATGGAIDIDVDLKGIVAKMLTNYDKRIGVAQGRVDTLNDQQFKDSLNVQIRRLQDARADLKEKVDAYINTLKAFENKKKQLRVAVDLLTKKLGMPKQGGSDLATAVQFLSQASTLTQQCNAALKVGKKEQEDAEQSQEMRVAVGGHYDPTVKRNALTGERFIESADGMSWYRVDQSRDENSENEFTMTESKVVFSVSESTKDQTGIMLKVDVEVAMKEIREIKEGAEQIRSRLAVVLGMEAPGAGPTTE